MEDLGEGDCEPGLAGLLYKDIGGRRGEAAGEFDFVEEELEDPCPLPGVIVVVAVPEPWWDGMALSVSKREAGEGGGDTAIMDRWG